MITAVSLIKRTPEETEQALQHFVDRCEHFERIIVPDLKKNLAEVATARNGLLEENEFLRDRNLQLEEQIKQIRELIHKNCV